MSAGWQVVHTETHGTHVIPPQDVVDHVPTEHCVCHPPWGAVWTEEETVAWVFAHSAMDGRP